MSLFRRLFAVAGCAALMIWSEGCGSRGGLSVVSGEVTYDGRPVQQGTINFFPADGHGPTAAAVIADGRYSFRAAPGKKRVTIEGFKVTGRKRLNPWYDQSPMVDVKEQYLPERYNVKSELTCEVAPGGGTQNFALEK